VTGHRAERVADRVRRELARLIHEELRDPRIGFVTLTDVDLSSDLRHARVFVTVMGEESRDATLEALNHAVPFLRRSLARKASLKFTPQLRFFRDGGEESGQRVDTILNGIEIPPEPDDEDGT